MACLKADFAPSFKKDIKRLTKKHVNLNPLYEVVELILRNSKKSKTILEQHHNMHSLGGKWKGCKECHVANAGDWLLIWSDDQITAFFQRTGTHDELFK